MTSRTLRRRLHHGDVDGKRHEHLEATEWDGLNEPLLGKESYENSYSEVRMYFYFLSYHDPTEDRIWLTHLPVAFSGFYLAMIKGSTAGDLWDDERRKEHLHWTLLFSQLIAQWAQWLGMQLGRY